MNKKPVYSTAVGYFLGMNIMGTYLDYFAVALGSTPFLQSILVSVRNLGGNLIQLLWGSLSDKKGRKKFFLYGFSVYAVTTLSFLWITSPVTLIIIVVAQSLLGSMVLPVWNALLGDYSVRKMRGSFIGEVTAVGTIASVFGILVVGYSSRFITDELKQYIIPFLVSVFSFVLAAVSSQRIKEKVKSAPSGITLKEALHNDTRFKKFLLIDATYKGVMALAWPLFAFVTVKVVGADKFQMSFIWAVHMFMSAVSQKYGGLLIDRIGRRKSLFLFNFPLFMVTFLYAVADNWIYLLVSSFFSGFSVGAGAVAVSSYILDCAHEEKRASYTAVNNLVFGIISFFSSLLAGAVATYLTATMGLFSTLQIMLYIFTILRILSAFLYLKTEETLEFGERVAQPISLKRFLN
ncbi:MAG: MFS transporter [Theionarchaea archaeon]|nr:MFS transporter [Theionarchaea archaeon]